MNSNDIVVTVVAGLYSVGFHFVCLTPLNGHYALRTLCWTLCWTLDTLTKCFYELLGETRQLEGRSPKIMVFIVLHKGGYYQAQRKISIKSKISSVFHSQCKLLSVIHKAVLPHICHGNKISHG